MVWVNIYVEAWEESIWSEMWAHQSADRSENMLPVGQKWKLLEGGITQERQILKYLQINTGTGFAQRFYDRWLKFRLITFHKRNVQLMKVPNVRQWIDIV
jgi:hypothetical protein